MGNKSDISEHEFHCEKRWLSDFCVTLFPYNGIGRVELTKRDAIALARHFKLTAEDIK